MSAPKRANSPEVANVFRQYGSAYQADHELPLLHLKVMDAIVKCRTEELGGHLDACDRCGYQHPFYNSCRNRHCPKCGCLAKERWLAARKNELLPVAYFHTVLTLPDDLKAIALVNQRVIYDILFRAGSETLLTLGRDPKHLGGEIGLLAVLHTWGQNLLEHPHLHCIVTGGGLSPACPEQGRRDGHKWFLPNKTTKKRNFFVHVDVISDLFKKKFLAYLKQAYQTGKLEFVGKTAYLADKRAFQKLIDTLYNKKWVTYCKEPFGNPKAVLAYLARYSHRVAISNNRIVKLEDSKVTFKWRDNKDGGQEKLMTLDAFEFIRRFLLHVLPKNFYKIRYYGIWSSRNRKTKLKKCQEILQYNPDSDLAESASLGWEDLLYELTGIDARLCPKCQKGRMVTIEILPKMKAAPP
jgi:hypothetical protein